MDQSNKKSKKSQKPQDAHNKKEQKQHAASNVGVDETPVWVQPESATRTQ
jgi:hypothetical protein